ncbi:hypothetical protein [Halorussus aquaticus]|uniref:Uncharacterized protein n=1 Tax=Halorussus aquaticus TaxID=2953748 RepID=A0ABD5Q3G4_9EURY|nr:hypothetical protein [Halorussus aquaticus]
MARDATARNSESESSPFDRRSAPNVAGAVPATVAGARTTILGRASDETTTVSAGVSDRFPVCESAEDSFADGTEGHDGS